MSRVLSGVLLASLAIWSTALLAAEPAGADVRTSAGVRTSADVRTLTLESTLKDLSQANDAAIRHGHVTAKPGRDALGHPRADLVVEPPPEAAALVQGEVHSGLHKLKRETAHRQTADTRQARVEASLDRTAEDAGADH